tara:strand:- start:19 stop:258 length:240 start_codon:yes stop_codon:yes gene_type:complete
MPRFTNQKEFTYLETFESLALLTSHGTNGVLTIESHDGTDWILTDTITTTGGKELFVKGQRLRFTPTLGMTYSIARGKG